MQNYEKMTAGPDISRITVFAARFAVVRPDGKCFEKVNESHTNSGQHSTGSVLNTCREESFESDAKCMSRGLLPRKRFNFWSHLSQKKHT